VFENWNLACVHLMVGLEVVVEMRLEIVIFVTTRLNAY